MLSQGMSQRKSLLVMERGLVDSKPTEKRFSWFATLNYAEGIDTSAVTYWVLIPLLLLIGIFSLRSWQKAANSYKR